MTTFKTLAGALMLFALVACGGSKTQSKVDSANDDYQRMRVIDVELRSLGVNLNEGARAAATIEMLDPATLERVRGLLSEFLSRGDSVVSVAQRKDVRVSDGMGNVEYALRQANHLKIKVLEVMGARSKTYCAPGAGSSATASQAAQTFVGGNPALASRIDWDRVRSERLETGCGVYRVTFRTKDRSSCAMTVLVKGGLILHDRSDSDFICRH